VNFHKYSLASAYGSPFCSPLLGVI